MSFLVLQFIVQEPGGGFHAPPPPSGLTYIGWKIIKKYYLNHLFPKKILVPRPQKWGLKMGQILNLFSKCGEKYHKMGIFWKKISIFHTTKLCSKILIIYVNQNFKHWYTIPNPKTQKRHFEFSWKKIKCKYFYFCKYSESKTKMLPYPWVCHQKNIDLTCNFWHQTFPKWHILNFQSKSARNKKITPLLLFQLF